jgi:hypothetical protein
MNRHASVALRRLVDEAVGPVYDRVFLRLDLLLASREGRCGCGTCRERTEVRRADLVGTLPPV